MTFRHKRIPIEQNHAAHAQEFADRADRISKLPTDFEDYMLNRLALQLDNNSFWRLSQRLPTVKWVPVTGSVMFHQLQADQILNIAYNAKGLIERTDYASGYYCTISYTEFDKVDVLSYHRASDDVIVEQQTYAYDAEDRMTSSTQTV